MSSAKSILAILLALLLVATVACASAPSPTPTTAPAPAPAAKPTSALPAAAPTAPAPKPTSAPAAAPAAPAAKPAAAPPAPAAKPAPALTKVRYGLPTAPPAITTVGVYYALDNGYFKEEGLDVEVTAYPGSTTAIRALLSRDADIVETGGDTAFLAQAAGAPIKIISSPVAKGTDAVVVDKSVGSLKDLAGKSWAISTPGDTSHIAAQILAEKNGVDPSKINFVALGGPADRARALISGRVNASSMTILILTPILEAMDKGDLKVLTDLAKEFPDLPLAYNITRDDVAKGQADMLTRFLKAETKGYRWAQKNPDKAAQIAMKYIKEVPLDLMTRGMKGMSELNVYGLDGGITMAGTDRTQKLLVSLGKMQRTIKAEDVVTTTFVEQAVKALGPVQ